MGKGSLSKPPLQSHISVQQGLTKGLLQIRHSIWELGVETWISQNPSLPHATDNLPEKWMNVLDCNIIKDGVRLPSVAL